MKEWGCCKKKSHDFSLFLGIPGCKTGKHTTEKPVLSKPVAAPKPAIKTSAPATNVSAKDACPRASDKCQREKRKTINGDDLLWAMTTLGFEDYIEPLKLYLNRYKEMEGDTKGSGKGHEGSARKKDRVQHDYNEHLAHQGSYLQGLDYGNPQVVQYHSLVIDPISLPKELMQVVRYIWNRLPVLMQRVKLDMAMVTQNT